MEVGRPGERGRVRGRQRQRRDLGWLVGCMSPAAACFACALVASCLACWHRPCRSSTCSDESMGGWLVLQCMPLYQHALPPLLQQQQPVLAGPVCLCGCYMWDKSINYVVFSQRCSLQNRATSEPLQPGHVGMVCALMVPTGAQQQLVGIQVRLKVPRGLHDFAAPC